ncbi:MAG: membrane protein insertase YidC [Spirochaetia bacterium]|nr:membrane protein insertase YidC [Spirochaetia bacterium]
MSNDQKKEKPSSSISSFLPLILMGASVFFLMRILAPGEEEKETPAQQTPSQETSAESSGLKDFVFQKGGNGQDIIKTKNFVAVLGSGGGRIDKFYLISNDALKIPESVTREKDDPIGSENKALEVTRGNGMDFQPHLYYRRSISQDIIQIGNPPLNQAGYRKTGPVIDEATGIQEIRFSLPVMLNGYRMEVQKIYRFLPNEYYFHQMTLLRNLENREFKWNGDIFFKSMGDMGPSPDQDDTYSFARFTRFYEYADSMTTVPAVKGGSNPMSCGTSFCGGEKGNEHYHALMNSPNTLKSAGSTSKYFFSYNKFLGHSAGTLSTPDGIIVVNEEDPTGKKSQSVYFSNIHLDKRNPEALPIQKTGENMPFYEKVRNTQRRSDLILIDNMVYVGVRRDESHTFRNASLVKSEFGLDEPDEETRSIIYSNDFFTVFSGIKDGVVWLMRVLYSVIGNYGWVIILIATTLKLVTWPLNQMQAKSMKKMSALKPEIESINERFKENPTEKQKQIMLLYKKHNVNPAKGCFPILIQLPVFIALYSAFSDSIELWRSPFIFWMDDLSLPDTVYIIKDLFFIHNFHINILPLIMVVSQIMQQMFTTVVTDPQQKTIMYFMPVIMIFFFWSMPSGVTLYWTVQNILSIVWQFASDRLSKDDTGKGSLQEAKA